MRPDESYDLLDEPYVVCWKDLDEAAERTQLDRLGEWVVWLTARYSLDYKAVPNCWQHHGALVEELSALRTLWEGCFDEDAASTEPITFHRELDAALRRLREWNSRTGCARTLHRPEDPAAS